MRISSALAAIRYWRRRQQTCKRGFRCCTELREFLESPTVMGLAKQVESIVPAGQATPESDKDEREEFEI